MNVKLIAGALAITLLAVVSILISSSSQNQETAQQQAANAEVADVTAESCLSEDCLKVENLEYPVSELPQAVIEALNAAIDDEYKARATYEAVINKLGSVRPFSMIIRAEEKHISSLKAIYDKYGLEVPADPYQNLEVATTIAANCAVGVQAEIDNAGLYRNNLLPAVVGYPDISSVFTQLMNASQDNHLPAFEGCAS